MSTALAVARIERHTRGSLCSICGGHAGLPQGQGLRCAGFTLGHVVYCTREEYAARLPLDISTSPPAYKADVHKDVQRDGVAEQTRYMSAVQIVVGEVAEEFGGEDPALPRMRELIDGVARRLEEVREESERHAGPLAVVEPDAELVDKVRALVEDRAVMQFGADARVVDLGA